MAADSNLPTTNDWPTFYIYEDSDGWHRTDKRLTEEINGCVFLRHKFDPAGRRFYPQWPEPKNKSEARVAWVLNENGYRAARWRWIERDHKKTHANCEPTIQGKCRSRVLVRLSYDSAKRLWTQIINPKEITP